MTKSFWAVFLGSVTMYTYNRCVAEMDFQMQKSENKEGLEISEIIYNIRMTFAFGKRQKMYSKV